MARLLLVGPIAFFSDDDDNDDNDNYDVVESMSHRVYRPYGMFTLAKRTNSHMSKSRLHNVSPAPSPSRLSLFRIFRRESGGWIEIFLFFPSTLTLQKVCFDTSVLISFRKVYKDQEDNCRRLGNNVVFVKSRVSMYHPISPSLFGTTWFYWLMPKIWH